MWSVQQLTDIEGLNVRAAGGRITGYTGCGTEVAGRIHYLVFGQGGRWVTIGWSLTGVAGGRSSTLLAADGWKVEVSADQRTLTFNKETPKDVDRPPVTRVWPSAQRYTIELREV